MIEKAQKVGFFSPDKPENHTDKGKGKNKKKERGGRKEEKGGGGEATFALKISYWLLCMKKKTKTKTA